MISYLIRNALVVFFLVLSMTLGCSDWTEQNENGKAFDTYHDESLAQVSGLAAIMLFKIEIKREISCLMRDVENSVTAKNEDNRSTKEKNNTETRWLSSYRKECEFFTSVKKTTNSVFSLIKSTSKLPKVAFSFVAVDYENLSDEEDMFDSVEIGLFSDYNECERFGQMARSIDMATTACKTWKPQNLMTLDEMLSGTPTMSQEQKNELKVLREKLK